MIREIITINEELCDSCGLCIPACQEGALRLVSGKARLVADRLCDGLGACLGHCPRGAIKIERREAEEFDEAAVAAMGGESASADSLPHDADTPAVVSEERPTLECGCPGARLMRFDGPRPAARPAEMDADASADDRPSELTHWPVQLRLLPTHAPMLREARLLVAADCVPVACADFHAKLLRGRTVVIACPKFDDLPGYVEKLTEMIRVNRLRDIVVARMEVPCCTGIMHAVTEARRRAGVDVPVIEVIVSTRGEILARRELPREAVA